MHLPVVLDPQRIVADEQLGELVDGGAHGLGLRPRTSPRPSRRCPLSVSIRTNSQRGATRKVSTLR